MAAVSSVPAQAQAIQWWTTGALEKIRPFDSPPAQPAREVELYAARNEFEPFQIVLRANAADVPGVDVEVSDLAGPGGIVAARQNVTVYLEAYIPLKSASSLEGAAGEWPDPLIPRIDRYAGEKRNAFPFHLSRDRNQPIWVDVYVPLGTRPGKYEGQARITAGGKQAVSIPVHLNVWNFTLPSTSSLPTAFGFSGPAAMKKLNGRYTTDQALHEIVRAYAKAALLHRISTYGGAMAGPPFHNGKVEWKDYDREVGPFLDGRVLGPGEPLPGAKVTSIDLRTPAYLDGERRVEYYKEWIKHFREKGWLSRLYNYLWDEPRAQDYQALVEKGRLAHSAGPEIHNLVTVPLHKDLAPVVDIWAPLVNCVESKPGFRQFCDEVVPPDGYAAERKAGKRLWWYQSCASHGCGGSGGEYFRGWPSYAIDVTPVANRISEWLAFKYDIEGELYYATNEAWGRTADPWTNVYFYGGNGDGTLFYPGQPSRVGGETSIPIESIRLKLIREGLEDYEYLALLSKMGMADLAHKAVDTLASAPYQWDSRPQSLYSVRRMLGDKLSETAGRARPQQMARAASGRKKAEREQ